MSESRISSNENLAPWDGERYGANTGHHRRFDEWFLSTLPLLGDERILDVGCGSGDFTAALAELVPRGIVVGLEPQSSMLAVARRAARPNQTFVLARAQDARHVLGDETAFDVVVSRAVLQWVPEADHPGILAGLHALLRPGGRLRIDAGGAGNIGAMVELLADVSPRHGGPPPPWTFLDAGRWLELVEEAGFELGADGYVRTVAQRRPFDRAGLHGWLESQCYQGFDAAMAPDQRAAFRAEVEARLGEVRRADGSLDQTFVRADVLAYRPSP